VLDDTSNAPLSATPEEVNSSVNLYYSSTGISNENAEDPTLHLDIDWSSWIKDPEFSIAPPDPNTPSLNLEIPFHVDGQGPEQLLQEYAFLHDIPSPILLAQVLDDQGSMPRNFTDQA
jgi:hypothetical protein